MNGPQKLCTEPLFQDLYKSIGTIKMSSGRMNTQNGKNSIFSNLPEPLTLQKKITEYKCSNEAFPGITVFTNYFNK